MAQDRWGALSERIVMAPPLADAKRARARLAELIERAEGKPEADALLPLLREGRFRDLTAALADHSPFLWRLAFADSGRLANLATHAPEETHRDLVDAQAGLYREAAAGRIARDDVVRALRRNRNAHALLVALADIGGIWDCRGSRRRPSQRFRRCLRARRRQPRADRGRGIGRIILQNPDDPGDGSGFVVLALGKHGAGELELFQRYRPRRLLRLRSAAAAGRRGAGAVLRPHRPAVRRDLLQERTADGYVHRVDYRLRPDPGSTPVAVSLSSAYTYYETVGQNWERAALIKARPVAGDLALGERFLGRSRARSSGASISTSPRSPTFTP